jgi:hypothetical protein
MKLTPQQLAHTLAALRYCQAHAIDLSGMEHFTEEGLTPLDNDGVNALCEAINTVDDVVPLPVTSTSLILHFKLPEDQCSALRAVRADALAGAWWAFLEDYLHPMVKWQMEHWPEAVQEKVQEVFDKAYAILRESELSSLIGDC